MHGRRHLAASLTRALTQAPSRSISSTPSLLQTLDPSVPSPSPPPAAEPGRLAELRRRLQADAPSLGDFAYSVEVGTRQRPLPKPKWMKETVPGGAKYAAITAKLREL